MLCLPLLGSNELVDGHYSPSHILEADGTLLWPNYHQQRTTISRTCQGLVIGCRMVVFDFVIFLNILHARMHTCRLP